jgi:hypothetical protein
MAVSVDNRPTRTRSALAALLTVLILVPAGYLFYRVWQANDEARDSTKLEQQGVEYLTNLSPLISSLAESESSALQGVSAAPASVTAAVARVGAVDQRLGEALGTRERWAGLRDKIGRLPGVAGDPTTVFQAHVEVTDLALGLYDTVRNNSTLVRDPDNDLSHLQQAVAVDLPNTVVQVNRMGDLSLMLANVRGNSSQRAAQQAALGPQFGAAVQTVGTAVASLTDNLQAAVDDTNSPTLSGNLVTSLDSFRRGVENLTRGANPGAAPVAATMATAQTQLQTSLNGLAGVTLREMGKLLDDRLDTLNTKRIEALAAAALVLLLIIAAVILRVTGRPRRHVTGAGGDENARGGMSVTQGGTDPGYGSLIDSPPSYGEGNPTRRERSGALR